MGSNVTEGDLFPGNLRLDKARLWRRAGLCNFMATITICSDFGAQKIKSDVVSTVCPSISHEVMGPDAMIFVF